MTFRTHTHRKTVLGPNNLGQLTGRLPNQATIKSHVHVYLYITCELKLVK